jgi:hypothetical protein
MPGVMASLAGISPFPATLTIDGHHHNHHHCHAQPLSVMVVMIVTITRIVMVAEGYMPRRKGSFLAIFQCGRRQRGIALPSEWKPRFAGFAVCTPARVCVEFTPFESKTATHFQASAGELFARFQRQKSAKRPPCDLAEEKGLQ